MNNGLGMLIIFLIEEKINEGRFAQTIVRKMKEQELIVKQQRDALLTQYLLESSAYQQAGTVTTIYLCHTSLIPGFSSGRLKQMASGF